MGTDERLGDADDDSESEEQRERYRELLEELRTIMPGTQVLFAFLLTAVFSQGFGDLDDLGKRAFATALLLAALAALTLMAPGAFHRMSEPGKRPERLEASIRAQITGMAMLLAAITIVLFVVVRQIFDDTGWGVAFAAVAGAWGVLLWYVLPRVYRLNHRG